MKFKRVALLFFFIIFIVISSAAHAIEIKNPLKVGSIDELVKAIVDWLIKLGAPVAAGMIIYGGFLILFAGGSPEKFENGKKTILYAVLGYGIIVIGWGIVAIIEKLLE